MVGANPGTSMAVYCSFSGGLDSTTMLTYFLADNKTVKPVFFYYGSKHNDFELLAAKRVIGWLAGKYKGLLPDYELPVIDMRPAFSNIRSALLAQDAEQIPNSNYSVPGSLAATVVPGRNLIMASVLASMAESDARQSQQKELVALGVHAGDHALYPDCRPEFVEYLAKTIDASTEGWVALETPFLYHNKAYIVKLGMELATPFELTRSCYKMQGVSCGECGTCRERLAAFRANNLQDPIKYASVK